MLMQRDQYTLKQLAQEHAYFDGLATMHKRCDSVMSSSHHRGFSFCNARLSTQAQLRGPNDSTDSQFLHPKCTGQSPRRNCFADTICPPVTKDSDRPGRNFKMVMKRAFKTTCSYSSCLHESAVLNESSNLRPVMSAVQICRRGWTDDVRRSHQKQRTPRIC